MRVTGACVAGAGFLGAGQGVVCAPTLPPLPSRLACRLTFLFPFPCPNELSCVVASNGNPILDGRSCGAEELGMDGLMVGASAAVGAMTGIQGPEKEESDRLCRLEEFIECWLNRGESTRLWRYSGLG